MPDLKSQSTLKSFVVSDWVDIDFNFQTYIFLKFLMCMSIPKELCEVYNCAKVQVSVQSDSSRWLSLQIALYPASSNESNVIGN